MAIKNYSDEIILVQLPGEPLVREELDKTMELVAQGGHCDVLVDFSSVDILVSLSLSGFLQLHKLITSNGRRMVFFNISNITKGIFEVTCFDGIFEFADSLADAETVLKSAPVPSS